MVVIQRVGRGAVRIELDRAGAQDLTSCFGAPRRQVEVFLDRRLFGGRAAHSEGYAKIPFQVLESVDRDVISILPDSITLELDADSIEYIYDRLIASVSNGFHPAEMCEVTSASDGFVTIYGELREDLVV